MAHYKGNKNESEHDYSDCCICLLVARQQDTTVVVKATDPIDLQQESNLAASSPADPIYDNAHELLATAGADMFHKL